MSELIDQLKAQSGDPRSDRELTLVYGDKAAQSGRTDVFTQHPDFAKEYASIKDELARMNRPGLLEEAKGGLYAAGDEMAAAGYGLGSLAARGLGMDQVSASLLDRARADEAAGQQYLPSVPSISDISGAHPIEDSAYYLARTAGGLLPSLGLAAVSGGAGAALGPAVGLAGALGSEAGLAAGFAGQSIGSNYVAHPESPGADVAFGAASGLLGAVAPGYVVSRLAGKGAAEEVAQEALSFWQRFAQQAARTIPIGAGTTAATALVDMAADKYARGESPTDFTAADLRAALNAGVVGGVGGAIMAPFAAIPGGAGDAASRNAGTEAEPMAEPAPEEVARQAAVSAPTRIDTTGLPDHIADAVRTAEDAAEAIEQAPPASPLSPRSVLTDPTFQPTPPSPAPDAPAPIQDAAEAPRLGPTASDQAADPSQAPKALDPAAVITVQGAQGDNPGFVMIEQPGPAGAPPVVSSPDVLAAQGYEVPDTSGLAQGQYKASDVASGQAAAANQPEGTPAVIPPEPVQPAPPGGIPLQGAPGPVAPVDVGTVEVPSITSAPPEPPKGNVPLPGAEEVLPVKPLSVTEQPAPIPSANLEVVEPVHLDLATINTEIAPRSPGEFARPVEPVPAPGNDYWDKLMERTAQRLAAEDHGQGLLDEAEGAGLTTDSIVDRFFDRTWGTLTLATQNKLGDWFAKNTGLYSPETVMPETLKAYFTPGREVPSYGGGRDKVIQANFRPDGSFESVEVKGEDGRVRSHQTRPDAKTVIKALGKEKFKELQGPVNRTWAKPGFDWKEELKGHIQTADIANLQGTERGLVSVLLDGIRRAEGTDDFTRLGDSAVTLPAAPEGATIRPTDEGAKITPKPATEQRVSTLADRPQIRAQKEFLGKALKEAVKTAPETLAYDERGRMLLESIEQKGTPEQINTAKANLDKLGEQYGIRNTDGKTSYRGRAEQTAEERIRTQIQLDHAEHVTIEVPGDGTFRVPYAKSNLTNFAQAVERRFGKDGPIAPGPFGELARSNKPKAPSVLPRLAKNPKPADLEAAAKLGTTDEPTRLNLKHVLKDESGISVSTDGRRMILVAGGGGVTPEEIAATTIVKPGTKPADVVPNRFPNWRQVLPKWLKAEAGKIRIGKDAPEKMVVDTATAIKSIDQAMGVLTERSNSIKLYDVGGGKIGFSGQSPDVGDYRTEGVKDGLEPKTAINPEFLSDALAAARLAGHEKVNLYITDHLGPVVVQAGDNYASVMMPVRLATIRANPTVTSADFRSPPTSAARLLDSTVRALSQDRGVPVAPIIQAIGSEIQSAVKTAGMTLTLESGQKIVGYAVDSVHGPIKPQTIISLLHETGHVFTEGLHEDLRVSAQQAIDELPWTQQKWLNNPESLDVRLLAAADPTQLTEEQRSALATLTPAELAEARATSPDILVKEQMAEHLAQLGWDKKDATGFVDRLFRFVKDLWLKTSMAIQRSLKGPDSVNPRLAAQFVDNRWLQFINRDHAYAPGKINDLLNWIGVPQTTVQRQPNFPGGEDTEMRMQFADPVTKALIPISYGTFTPDALQAYLKRSVDNASRYVRDQQTGRRQSPEGVEFTKRATFSKPMPFDPSATHNVKLASVNLEDEIYNQIRQDPDIAGLLPRTNGQQMPHDQFMAEWMKLPGPQHPASMKAAVIDLGTKTVDPLTGKPIAFNPDITVNDLPSYTETLTDAEKNPVQVKLSEQQDEALTQTILSLRDTQRRMQAKFTRDNDRLNVLIEQRARLKAEFPADAQKELDELQRSTPLRQKIIEALIPRIRELDSKFDPRRTVAIYPTAEYLRVPDADATEEQIMAHGRGTVPRDLNFSNDSVKAALGQDLANMEEWLQNPDNLKKGAIYGTMQETYRKLMQVPTDLKRVNTAALLRRTITNGLAEELRLTGIPALIGFGKKIITVAKVNTEHRTPAHNLGVTWEVAFSKFAKSVGHDPDQTFRDLWWDPLNRIWDRVDVSRRGELKDPSQWRTPVDQTAKALNEVAGLKVTTDAQREALRDLMLATTDNNRAFMSIELQNQIKVQDDALGYQRRLIPRGIVGGRRTFARHLMGLFARMNPDWSDTKSVAENDPRSFWAAAGDLYRENRPLFDKQMQRMFSPYVVDDFVDPWVNDNDPVFPAPKTVDDSTNRMAAPVRVRAAWRDAKGDVTAFAERLHALEGGDEGDEAQTVRNVLSTLRAKFYEQKTAVDGQLGRQSLGHEIVPRQLMDARVANNWPAEHVSYATYTPTDNAIVLQHLAMGAAFGHDAVGATSEMHMTLAEARRDLAALWQRHEELVQRGLSKKQVEAKMGSDDAKIARNYYALSDNIKNIEQAFVAMSTHSGYMMNDFKAMNAALSFFSQMMISNPRSGAMFVIGDILGPMASLKLSAPALRVFRDASSSVAKDMATSIVRAFGIDTNFNTNLVHELYVNGQMEPDAAVKWRQKSALGAGLSLTRPSASETLRAKAARLVTRGARYGSEILPNAGSPFQVEARAGDEAAAVTPKLRIGVTNTVGQADYRANNRAGYNLFADLASRGLRYLNSLPDAIREQTVRQMELGTKDVDARQLGYNRGWLLNDEAAFASMKNSIETQMSGESSVGRFVAKAFRRQQQAEGGKFPILSNSQFGDIINLTNSYWTLQGNFATIPPWMAGPLRPLFTFLTWPYMAMQKFGQSFADPRGRMTFKGLNSSVADGMKTFFLLAAPATIAGSFAIDLYDKYALGKKQNLRETSLATALPGVGVFVDPKSFMERVGRYGSAGFAGDMLNRIVNYDTQRNLSLDDRIVAVSEIENLLNAVAVEPFQSGGNMTYSTTVRPFLQAAGAGGMLQYLQIVNNLLGLNNEEAGVNARINVNSYLRSAGRVLKLPVRVLTGPAEAPTPASPYLHQMELAAIVDNPELFRGAYQNAVRAAQQEGREKPESYVAQAFAGRHPLRRSFATSPTEGEYRQLLGLMDTRGAGQVRAAINNYNRYLGNFFNRQPFYGTVDKASAGQSIDQIIRRTTALSSSPYYSGLAIH